MKFACCFGVDSSDGFWQAGWEHATQNPVNCPLDITLFALLESSNPRDHLAVVGLLEKHRYDKSVIDYLSTSPMQKRLRELSRGEEPSASYADTILRMIAGSPECEASVLSPG